MLELKVPTQAPTPSARSVRSLTTNAAPALKVAANRRRRMQAQSSSTIATDAKVEPTTLSGIDALGRKVIFTLYGVVSEERLARERKILKHRVENLNWIKSSESKRRFKAEMEGLEDGFDL